MTESQYYYRYDHAWKTPGWTVQNPIEPSPQDGYVDPGMGIDVTMVRLYGAFMEMGSGRGLEGVLRLRVNTMLTHGPTGKTVPAGDLKRIRFKRDGFSLYLPATDDPDLTPEFEYEGRLTVRGVTKEFTFSLPMDVLEVDINTLL